MEQKQINIQSRLLEVLLSLTSKKDRLLHCVISQKLLHIMQKLPEIYVHGCYCDDMNTICVPVIVEQYVSDHILEENQSIYMYELVHIYEITKMRYELVNKKSTTK